MLCRCCHRLERRTAQIHAGRPKPCAQPETTRDGRPPSQRRPAPRPPAATKGRRKGQRQKARQRNRHSDRQKIRRRRAVGVQADKWLKQRRGDLIDKCNQPDLTKAEMERPLQNRVDRGQQRLHQVVQHVAKADRNQHLKKGRAPFGPQARMASPGSWCSYIHYERKHRPVGNGSQ